MGDVADLVDLGGDDPEVHGGAMPPMRGRMTALKELAREYWANRPMELAAALSYYTLLSLAPLVLMAVAVAGLVFDRATVEGRIVTEMRLLVGAEGSEVVQTVLRHARRPGEGRALGGDRHRACSSSGRPRCSCSCRAL